jgi:hypothetical protein
VEWCGVASIKSMMASPDGMVHWGLGEGRTKMDSRGVDALFGVVRLQW